MVSAEDIGKLPDSSIAEAIARLPGIAAQRTNGRAQTLSIRGLGPDFTVTTFNGREQASTNDNRTVEFDQYPSELVTQVKIYKTPDAGMAYQGIAGTTDIATVHPLAYSDRKFAVGYKREMNDQEANIPGLPDAGDRVNLTYIDQFNDNTAGCGIWYRVQQDPVPGADARALGLPGRRRRRPAHETIIGGDKDGVKSSFYERMSFMGVLEFKPNDQLHMLLDAYHSDFNEVQTIQRMEYGTLVGRCHAQRDQARSKTAAFSRHVYNVPFVVIENYNNDRDAKVDSIGLNTKFQVSDDWGIEADLSWSKCRTRRFAPRVHGRQRHTNDPDLLPQPDNVTFTTRCPTASRSSRRRWTTAITTRCS